MSLVEAVANVVVGFAVALLTQIGVFPLFGLRVSLGDNLALGAVFTAISLARSYALRRLFEAFRMRSAPGTSLDQRGSLRARLRCTISSSASF